MARVHVLNFELVSLHRCASSAKIGTFFPHIRKGCIENHTLSDTHPQSAYSGKREYRGARRLCTPFTQSWPCDCATKAHKPLHPPNAQSYVPTSPNALTGPVVFVPSRLLISVH